MCPISSASFSSIFSLSSFLFLAILLFTICVTKSIKIPAIIPTINFIPNIFNIIIGETASDINIGSISSDVDKYTAISVPNVITRPAYKFVADTEKPHCGNAPRTLPIIGPHFPDFFIACFVLCPILCSIYSIIKYVINKKGNNFIASTNVSCIISNIFIPPEIFCTY